MEDVCKLRCSASSDNTLGCILSWPGDLLVFNFLSNLHIVSIVMSLSAILGMFFSENT